MYSSQDPRYKVFSPNWARIEELGSRGLDTKTIKTALKFNQIKSFLTHTAYLTQVMNLSFTDKDPTDDPLDSTYRYATDHVLYVAVLGRQLLLGLPYIFLTIQFMQSERSAIPVRQK